MKSLKAKIRGLNKDKFDRLKQLTEVSKNLYNQSLYVLKQQFNSDNSYISFPKMDKIMKDVKNLEGAVNYRLMKAKLSQNILRKLDKNFNSFFKEIKDYSKHPEKYKSRPNPPKYIKAKQYNVIYDYQSFQIKDDYVVFEKNLKISIPKPLLNKTIKQIEIKPKYGYFEAIFVYEDEQQYKQIELNNNILAIDLGLNNLCACTSNGIVEPFIIDGRKLKSINQLYNKRVADKKSDLDKCQQNKKWSDNLQIITNKRNNAVNDYLHKTSRIIINKCLDNNISQIIIGDVSKAINGINLGKKNNQNFVNISLGQLVSKITYKAELHNIKVTVTNESYTSKASFIDNDIIPKTYETKNKHDFSGKRIYRGLYKSKTGILINADINGSYNILRKSKPEFNFSNLVEKLKEGIADWLHPKKYLIS